MAIVGAGTVLGQSIIDRAIRNKEITENLRAYFPEAVSDVTVNVIDSVAQLANFLEQMIEQRAELAWDPSAVRSFCGMTDRLLHGLMLLGTGRIAASHAEQIAEKAVVLSDDLLDRWPTEGRA